jgi:ADP-ribose pyrophosphatase YjhB (NUDIX family)
VSDAAVREWVVAGALLEASDHLLLVRNLRRGGHSDWSTPGGVIDATDADVIAGLTREVEEETGLRVTEWEGPLYEVRAVAPDMGWVLRAEVYRAVAYEGVVRVEDPDGIVVEVEFMAPERGLALLADGARWIHEPLADWIGQRWGPGEARGYSFHVRGVTRGELEVQSAHWGR